jgi:hypothetical protein
MNTESLLASSGKYTGQSLNEIANVDMTYITYLASLSKNRAMKNAAQSILDASILRNTVVADAVVSATSSTSISRGDIDTANQKAHMGILRNFVAKFHLKRDIKVTKRCCKADLYVNNVLTCTVGYWYDLNETSVNGKTEQALATDTKEIVLDADTIGNHFFTSEEAKEINIQLMHMNRYKTAV